VVVLPSHFPLPEVCSELIPMLARACSVNFTVTETPFTSFLRTLPSFLRKGFYPGTVQYSTVYHTVQYPVLYCI